MKRVMLDAVTIGGSPMKGADILSSLVQGTPLGTGMTLGEMGQRLRVVEKLDQASRIDIPWCDLEDADYDVLKRCVDGGSYTMVSRGLYDLLMAVLQAEAPPPPVPLP